jgi:hypothetical protein
LGKFAHPIAYYLGLIAIYFSFGIIASLTGGAFNQLLSYPLTNLSIGIFLFLLALATVDLLHIPFFGGEVDSKNQGLWGTGLMGAGAGLLSSACVGPIVVSVLVGIASNSTEINILLNHLDMNKDHIISPREMHHWLFPVSDKKLVIAIPGLIADQFAHPPCRHVLVKPFP